MKSFLFALLIFSASAVFSSSGFAFHETSFAMRMKLKRIESRLDSVTKSIQEFYQHDYASLLRMANNNLGPEIYLNTLRKSITQELGETRAQIIQLRPSIEKNDLIAKYDLMLGRALTDRIIKTDNHETRFFNLLATNTEEQESALLIPVNSETMIALRKNPGIQQALSDHNTGKITSLYAVLGWQEAFATGVEISNPVAKVINKFTNFSQVRFFRELLRQGYSLNEWRMQPVLTIAAGNDYPAIMLGMLAMDEVDASASEIYSNFFKIHAESQIEYATWLVTRSKEQDIDASSEILVKAAIQENQKFCNIALGGGSSPWLLKPAH